jgi:hypothetical protein
MGLDIVYVNANPLNLTAGQTQIEVTAQVTSDSPVTLASAQIDGLAIAYVHLDPVSGTTPPTYQFHGFMDIPLLLNDGICLILVSFKNEHGDYVTNNTTKILLARSIIQPQPQPEPQSQPDETDKCCCKVSLNITGGPVNIYICRDSKTSP